MMRSLRGQKLLTCCLASCCHFLQLDVTASQWLKFGATGWYWFPLDAIGCHLVALADTGCHLLPSDQLAGCQQSYWLSSGWRHYLQVTNTYRTLAVMICHWLPLSAIIYPLLPLHSTGYHWLPVAVKPTYISCHWLPSREMPGCQLVRQYCQLGSI